MYWYEKAAVYHIYPLGYLDCPKENDYKPAQSPAPILRVTEHIPELVRLGFDTLYIGPLFESVRHAYDTVDYFKVDSRLGTNADFAHVCKELHKAGIRVVLDGVFNHVGRDFWAFKDVRENKFASKYKDWFFVRDGNSNYNDGFWYEGWEGHYELVKLNLYNGDVRGHIKDAVSAWVSEFDIDGLRLDVAYCLELNFLRELHGHCKSLKSDFWLMGETLHGDYNRWANPEMLDSVTNYECYKGLYSSFNELNMFEIAHSLNRQFGPNGQGLYCGKKFYCFLDNHDVTRIASILKEPKHLYPIYALLFTMPGVPGVYYGSEYGVLGDKKNGDDALRPAFSDDFKSVGNAVLSREIAVLTRMHRFSKALSDGIYKVLQLNNKQFAFCREKDNECVITLLNADSAPYTFNLNLSGSFVYVITGRTQPHPFTVNGCGCAVVTTDAELVRSVYVDLYGDKSEPAKREKSEKPSAESGAHAVSDNSVSFFGDSLFSLGKGGYDAPSAQSKDIPAILYDFESEYNPAAVKAEEPKPKQTFREKIVSHIEKITAAKAPKAETAATAEEKAAPVVSAVSNVRSIPEMETDIATGWHSWDNFEPDEPFKATAKSLGLERPRLRLKAVFFDMDGTVIDTETIHMRAWQAAFEEEHMTMTEKLYKEFIGLSDALMMRLFYGKYKDTTDGADILFYKLRYKMAVYSAHYKKSDGIPLKKGFAELSGKLSELGIKSYIVTSSFNAAARTDLRTAGVSERFSGIVGCDDTESNKPSAQPYEKAFELAGAQIPGLEKSDCMVIEDSTNGLLSAHAAGLPSIYIKDMADASDEALKTARYRFNDLSEIIELL